MIRIVLSILILTCGVALHAETLRQRVDRLFTQASSGEIRFQKLVQPSKDSLSAMGDSAALYLLPKLTTTDAREKLTLVDIYRGIGKPATPYLLTALNTENKDQLKTTCRCFADIKDSTAIDAIAELTTHMDFTVRMESITAIAKSGRGQQSTSVLIPLRTDSIDIVRKCVAYGLGTAKHPPAIPLLLESLDDPSYAVRLVAYDALAANDSIARGTIEQSLAGNNSDSKKALLIRLCGQLGITQSRSRIVEFTKDPLPAIRGWAIWSWSRMKDDAAAVKIKSLREKETDLFVLSQIDSALEYLATAKSHE